MSSILTNNAAMVALQTMRSINTSMDTTQNQISTGKAVGSARDNAAIWAISKVMESDVAGFKGISDSLALGQATVSVARQASETVTDLLTQMKGQIVAAQDENVDRDKIQEDIVALREQIRSVVGAAQFNGLNLVNGTQSDIEVLSSLDRALDGSVSSGTIEVAEQNLGSAAGAPPQDALSGDGVSGDGSVIATFIDAGGDDIAVEIEADGNMAAGSRYIINISGQQVGFTITEADLDDDNDTNAVIAAGVRSAILSLGIEGLTVDLDEAELTITNNGDEELAFTMRTQAEGAGGLSGLQAIDVSSALGAADALAEIEGLIQTAVNAAAAFGSVQGRIDSQAEFIKGLSDSLTSGIGALVDADMEAASARLQALQVQQQLGIQALSIANQQPQNILALFR